MSDDARRFTRLYDAYSSRVLAYAVSRVGTRYADEVVSETFVVAWRRIADVPADPLPWLLVVARNIARAQLRADSRRAAIDDELRTWARTAERVGDVADHVVDRAAVLRALASLSPHDREVLTLVAWHGLSPARAARALGCSRAAYFVRLHRARRRLERAMEIDEGTTEETEARVMRSAARLVQEGETVT